MAGCTLYTWCMMLWGCTPMLVVVLAVVSILTVVLITGSLGKCRIRVDAMGKVCILT